MHPRPMVLLIFLLAAAFFSNAQQPELILPVGHSQIVRTAAFSPDDKYVVTAGVDRVVNVWETFSGKKIRALEGMKAEVSSAWFSDDFHYLVAASDSAAIIWKLPYFELIAEIPLVRRIQLTKDGKRAFIEGFDGKTKQYSLPAMSLEREYYHHRYVASDTYRRFYASDISNDGKKILFIGDKGLNIYDVLSGTKIKDIDLEGKTIRAFFTPDDNSIIAATDSGLIQIDSRSFASKKLSNSEITLVSLSHNRKFLLASTGDMTERTTTIWDVQNMKPLMVSDSVRSVTDSFLVYTDTPFEESEIRTGTASFNFPDRMLDYSALEIDDEGQYVRVMYRVFNIRDNRRSFNIQDNVIRFSDFNKNGRYLLIQQKAGDVSLWDAVKNKVVQQYKTRAPLTDYAELNSKGTAFITGNGTNTVKLVDVKTGRIISILADVNSAEFSPDGTKILTNSKDTTPALWDAETGRLLENYPGRHTDFHLAYHNLQGRVEFLRPQYDTVAVFNPIDPGKIDSIVIYKRDVAPEYVDFLRLKNGYTGKFRITHQESGLYLTVIKTGSIIKLPAFFNAVSRDDRYLVFPCADQKDCLAIFDIESGKWMESGNLGIQGNSLRGMGYIEQYLFTYDNKHLFVADDNSTIHVLSVPEFKEEYTLPGNHFSFSADGSLLLILNRGKIDLYNFKTRELLYSYLPAEDNNYLVIDPKKRFDGTEAARRQLYFSCGMEIIELAQAKDQLWVPGLAERIMKNDSINNQTISDINICGLTPEVEEKTALPGARSFLIRPRRGGLGEVVVLVNGIEALRYKPEKLKKVESGYELTIYRSELQRFFVTGEENRVTVKAYTSGNTISSRGLIVSVSEEKTVNVSPNLYLVVVGVNDYKGEALDLKYASKDATDLSKAIKTAAKKLLNSEGQEHVFVYNLSNSSEKYMLPEKNAIRKVFEEIGKKATANDILLLFFAGHGIMERGQGSGDKNQFYFLTADASAISGVTDLSGVAISTAELTEWIRPQNIRAQKRVLIFDACNSGQAINDFVKMGKEDQGYVVSRNDDKGQQIKAIEKLNEQSGLFILSASASNQSAYEMGQYSQGLLTYALLRAIKEQPDILQDGKYLDVSRWFAAAEKTVSDLTRGNAGRQQPQIVSNTNFNIGVVDEEVMSSIILPEEKPLFTASSFINSSESADGDDLELSKWVNLQLSDISTRGGAGDIIYSPVSNSPKAYTLSGRYDVNDNVVTIRVSIRKNKEVVERFELKGSKDKLMVLAESIAKKAEELVK